jgi:hypothetical protein
MNGGAQIRTTETTKVVEKQEKGNEGDPKCESERKARSCA